MRSWPSPFGKRRADSPDVGSDSADPRCLAANPTGPIAWPTYNPADATLRRKAKGEPPRTEDEVIYQVHGRPRQQRTPVPAPGDRVSYIRDEWGDPEPCTVLQVQQQDEITGPGGVQPRGRAPIDPNLLINHGQDPMPLVLLQTDEGFCTWTREARVRGSAGWRP